MSTDKHIIIKESTPAEIEEQLSLLKESYTDDLLKTESISAKEANRRTLFDIERVLSDSENNLFFTIYQKKSSAGFIWLTIDNTTLFISNLFIHPTYRHKHIGTWAIEWIENFGINKDFLQIALHVFSHNELAIKLYKRQGFTSASCRMLKPLSKF